MNKLAGYTNGPTKIHGCCYCYKPLSGHTCNARAWDASGQPTKLSHRGCSPPPPASRADVTPGPARLIAKQLGSVMRDVELSATLTAGPHRDINAAVAKRVFNAGELRRLADELEASVGLEQGDAS